MPSLPSLLALGLMATFALAACGSRKGAEVKEIIQVEADDAEMNQAMQKARDTFPAFWKELEEGKLKDSRRSLSLVKAFFTDNPDKSSGEHMWVSDFSFDGKTIQGRLVDQPEHVRSVKEGDQVSFPLSRLSDWLLVRDGKAVGAVTVNLLRSRMSAEERKAHDSGYPFSFD